MSLWSGAMEYAEDGDLWRGDEERSLRFFESLAEIPEEPEKFLEVMRLDNWLDGWLIHDWLDHASKYLISRYSSHNRPRLVEIYAKHGKEYGRESDKGETTSQGKFWGNEREGNTDSSDPPITQDPKPATLNPYPHNERLKENPKEGAGGGIERAGFFNSVLEGSRVPGVLYSQSELTGDGLSYKEVFEAFMPLFVFHAIMTVESFYERVRRCNVTPSAWAMLFLDKIHAVYRDRQGTKLIDDDADPVGMTMAGFSTTNGKRRHYPTEAARQLFSEIAVDYKKTQNGGRSKWAGKMSGPSITLELDRRKGKAGRLNI